MTFLIRLSLCHDKDTILGYSYLLQSVHNVVTYMDNRICGHNLKVQQWLKYHSNPVEFLHANWTCLHIVFLVRWEYFNRRFFFSSSLSRIVIVIILSSLIVFYVDGKKSYKQATTSNYIFTEIVVNDKMIGYLFRVTDHIVERFRK